MGWVNGNLNVEVIVGVNVCLDDDLQSGANSGQWRKVSLGPDLQRPR